MRRFHLFPRDSEGQQSEDLARVQGPLWAFNVFQLIGFTLNLTIVLTVALNRKRVRRTMVWYLFMSSWILFCVAYGLLFIFGYQGSQLPPPGLCLFQAALVYALPPLGALLTFGVLAQLYCAMLASINQRRPPKYVNAFLILVPIIAFFAVFVEVVVMGARDKDNITRDFTHMYCNLKNATPGKISALLVGVTSCAMLVLESLVIVTLFRYWDAFVRIREIPGNVLSGTMAFRVTVFSFMPMIALILSVISVLSHDDFEVNAVSNVAVASLSVIAAFIFGTQRDVMSSLAFWKIPDELKEITTHASSVGVPPVVRKEVFVSEV